MKEVGSLAGVEIDDRHIAAAHKLPDSKPRLIVKFIINFTIRRFSAR